MGKHGVSSSGARGTRGWGGWGKQAGGWGFLNGRGSLKGPPVGGPEGWLDNVLEKMGLAGPGVGMYKGCPASCQDCGNLAEDSISKTNLEDRTPKKPQQHNCLAIFEP